MVFKLDAGVTAMITGLAITNGNGGGDGAVYDLGDLTLKNCTLQGTSARGSTVTSTASVDVQGCSIDDFNQYDAGGIQNYGSADLVNDTFSGNNGADACVLFNSGTATLTNCTMTGNSTGFGSGGLYNAGTLKMYGGTISGNTGGDGGVFAFGGKCYLYGVSITGNSSSNGGGIVVSNNAILYANYCTISSNTARGAGGGLYDAGTATLSDCTISGNSAGSQGGGVAVGPLANQAVLTMTDSTVSGNTSVSNGGGVFNNGTATLTDCTIADNNADQGTNLFSADGGGLNNSGTATLVFCTISGNTTSYEGGGVYDGGLGTDAVTLTDTIVAGDSSTKGGTTAASDVVVNGGNSILTGTFNLVGTVTTGMLSGGSNIVGLANPDLGPLANNGGSTETMALEAGSPAIDDGGRRRGRDHRRARRPARHPDAGHRRLPGAAELVGLLVADEPDDHLWRVERGAGRDDLRQRRVPQRGVRRSDARRPDAVGDDRDQRPLLRGVRRRDPPGRRVTLHRELRLHHRRDLFGGHRDQHVDGQSGRGQRERLRRGRRLRRQRIRRHGDGHRRRRRLRGGPGWGRPDAELLHRHLHPAGAGRRADPAVGPRPWGSAPTRWWPASPAAPITTPRRGSRTSASLRRRRPCTSAPRTGRSAGRSSARRRMSSAPTARAGRASRASAWSSPTTRGRTRASRSSPGSPRSPAPERGRRLHGVGQFPRQHRLRRGRRGGPLQHRQGEPAGQRR